MRSNSSRFTLLELLIVVAIIGILLTLLLPRLNRVRELSRRAVCLSNLKQCGITSTLYAVGNNNLLNPSMGIFGPLESLWWIGANTKKGFDNYQMDWRITDCPNFKSSFTIGSGSAASSWGTYQIAYYYSGNLNTSNFKGPGVSWIAPKLLSDDNNLMLWGDRIQSANEWGAFLPHTYRGWSWGSKGIGISPNSLGSQGGNRLILDGSARWFSHNSMTGQKGSSTVYVKAWWKIEE